MRNRETFFKTIASVMIIVMLFVFGFLIYESRDKEEVVADNSSVIEELQMQISDLNENIDLMLCLIDQKDSELQVATFNLRQANAEIDSQARALDVLCDEIEAKNEEISVLTLENRHLEEELNGLSFDIEQNAQAIAELEERIQKNELAIAEINNAVDGLYQQLNSIEFSIAELENQVIEFQLQIDSFTLDIESLENDVSVMKTQVQQLTSAINEVKANSIYAISMNSNTGTNSAGNSYVVFRNSLCIQWGHASITNKGSKAVNLAWPYANSTSYVVVASFRRNTNDGAGLDGLYVYIVDSDTFNIVHDWTSNANGSYAYWIAIGIGDMPIGA